MEKGYLPYLIFLTYIDHVSDDIYCTYWTSPLSLVLKASSHIKSYPLGSWFMLLVYHVYDM